ncbi:hypothetical protein BHE90_008344 [Fusarium euwallaceae]|uniref:Uncharacterized protein n=1 Tax=Fusarium euwallaceae TaxID=1147111 RepID=A0A430LN65_9HYPO|nr:hypothetical protein BHE90_008344 [Fusarium euwallaceae]
MAHANKGEGHNSDTGDGGEARGSWNTEDMSQAHVSDDDGFPAEQEPVKGDGGADISSSSSNNEDKTPREDESQGQESSSDEEQGQEPSNTEDQEQEPVHEEHQEQQSSNEQHIDAEQRQRAVNNMTQGTPPTEEIQPIQQIQPVQEIQPVEETQPAKEIYPMATIDQSEGIPANDETLADEHERSFWWKLGRCCEGTLDCFGTCLVDNVCVRDVFNVETPELLCVSRWLDRIYQ